MWKRPESEMPMKTEAVNSKLSTPFDEPRETKSERPAVGAKTCMKGDLSGEEDLIIEGRVEGKVDFRNNSVTIGHTGCVKGDIVAKTVFIDGELIGDAFATEKVTVSRSGNVKGNITAPRVSLEDGAKLKGLIDMEPAQSAAWKEMMPNAVHAVEKASETVSHLKDTGLSAKGKSGPENKEKETSSLPL